MPAQIGFDARLEDRAIRAYNAAFDVAGVRGLDAEDQDLAARAAEVFVREGQAAAEDVWGSSLKIPSGCDFCCGGATEETYRRAAANARSAVALGVSVAARLVPSRARP